MRFVGTVYRSHHPWWSWDPESGAGAAIHGGRFNPRGMAALYTSLQIMTAVLEASQGFPYKFVPPLVLCSYGVDCDDVLDLRDPAVLSEHAISATDLCCAWKDIETRGEVPPSWAMTQRLVRAGIAGIIVPSFASGAATSDANVVFWRWGKGGPHEVALFDPDGRLSGSGRER